MQISSVSSGYYLQQMQQPLFSKTDADGSGAISANEFAATGPDKSSGAVKSAGKAAELFSKLDGSGDGELSSEEFSALFNRLESGTAAAMMQFQQPPVSPEDMFSSADADGDGSLTLDELTAAAPEGMSDDEAAEVAAKMVEAMDTDGDGEVTQAEMQAFEESRRAERGQMPPPPMMLGADEETETSSLAEMLASALDEEDETAEDGVAAQLQAYLKQMQSGSEEETSLAARIFA